MDGDGFSPRSEFVVSAEGNLGEAAKVRRNSPNGGNRSTLGQRGSFIGPVQGVVAVAIALGLWMREDRWFVPDRGLGYAFGIIGLSLMTLLLFYPLRKRLKFARDWGELRSGLKCICSSG